jgi:hypothetical protein
MDSVAESGWAGAVVAGYSYSPPRVDQAQTGSGTVASGLGGGGLVLTSSYRSQRRS